MRALLPALLLALLLPLPAGAADPDPAPAPRTGLATQDGTVQAVDLAGHALTVLGEGGPFTVSLDRNTLVYLPGGLATVADLHPGARVRVGRDGGRASWVEVREPPVERRDPAHPAPGTGEGPPPPASRAPAPAAPASPSAGGAGAGP